MEQPQTDSQPPTSNFQPPLSNKRFFRFLIGGIAAFILIVTVGAVSAAVYLLPTEDAFVRSVASKIPYPIAVVDGRFLTFRAFFDELAALEHYLTQSGEEAGATNIALLQETVLDAMIDRVLIEQMATDYSVSLDQTKVEALLADASKESGSEEAFLQEIETSFGWDKEVFLSLVVKPIVLAGQVREVIYADASQQSEARAQIDGYLSRMRSGEEFADVFASTEVENNTQGGDWEFMTLDQMPAEWSDIVATLELNVMSDVIELPDAYSILQVTEQVEGAEDTQYHVNTMIVMKRSIDDVMESYRTEKRIWRFLNI